MDIRAAAQTIRDTVSMDEVLALYGFRTKHGFMVCPFHGDTDASLKVYKGTGGWHCFGCGKGGSVIDFVMEKEGCDFRTAVAAIDHALHMGLRDEHENPYTAEAAEQLQQRLDRFVGAVNAYLDALKAAAEAELRSDLSRMKRCETLRMMVPPILTAQDYNFMEQWKETAQYGEYRIDRIEEMREEVAAWRRKCRRIRPA